MAKKQIALLESKEIEVRKDRAHSMRISTDALKDKLNGYIDNNGKGASEGNPYMFFRKAVNRRFGINKVAEIDGDIEKQLAYSLANVRAAKEIEKGVAGKLNREEIRANCYKKFKEIGELCRN